jgi:hypothetical protein
LDQIIDVEGVANAFAATNQIGFTGHYLIGEPACPVRARAVNDPGPKDDELNRARGAGARKASFSFDFRAIVRDRLP